MEKKTAVCVLAMHRSGSSALTRALSLMGLSLGPPDHLIEAKADNPTGFWEQQPLQILNDRMLRTLGRQWDTFAPLPGDSLKKLSGQYLPEMQHLIRSTFGDHSHIVWKDPRTLLLFPLWKQALEAEGYHVKAVLGLRHPGAVAESLYNRNGIPLLKGVAMWVAYHARIIEILRDVPVAVVDYEHLLEDRRSTLTDCFTELDLPLPVPFPDRELDAFIRQDLRHHQPAALDHRLRPFGFEAEKLYRELLSYKPGHKLTSSLHEALEVYGAGSLVFAADLEKANLDLETRHQQHQALEKAYCELEDTYHKIRDAYHESLSSLSASRNKTETLRERLSEIEAESLREQYNNLEDWAFHLQRQLKDHEQMSAHLHGELSRLHRSWSWKMTAPLRTALLGLKYTGRMTGVCLKEAPAAVHLLGREGPGSLFTQIKNRFQKERELIDIQLTDPESPEKKELSAARVKSAKEAFVNEQKQLLDQLLDSDEILDFTPRAPTRVSVLLVLYNRAELTLACLRSLQAHAGLPIELVIVDNASTDRTHELLDRVQGANVIRNKQNLHFLKACNQAGEMIKSEYLLFLNNDAQLCQGAIEAAIKVFDENENTGAVGGKIVLLDGTLQEAGSLIWDDGSCMGYGRGEDPDAPEYNFQRIVDYCSGAFLLTPARLFRKLGGFDERFAPAYYEEADYCLRLKELGCHTVYQPGSCIVHFEFASSKDPSAAVALQVRNREIFRDIHQITLRKHFSPGSELSILKARHANPAPPRLLYIDDRIPHPELGSGFPRAQVIVEMLTSLGCDITFIPLNFPDEDSYKSAYQTVSPWIEVMRGCGRADLERFFSSRAGYYDLLWVSRPDNMALVDQYLTEKPEWKSALRVIYDAEAVFTLREKAKAALTGSPFSESYFEQKLQKEIRLTRHADAIVSVTETESYAFKATGSAAETVVIPHALQVSPTTAGFSERKDLLFVGNLQIDGSPNVDSVLWFTRHVWPSLRRALPGLKLHVVGRNGARSLERLDTEGIILHGEVKDLRACYAQCRLFVAPTRFSAGIPIKVLDAAAHGLPTIVTEGLASQLQWTHDMEAGVATGPQQKMPQAFAGTILQYYNDETAWTRLRQNALQRVEQDCSREQIRERVRQALKLPSS